LDRNADVVQSFDKQFGAPSATSTKTKFANRGWFGIMEASSANNLLKQETGRSHDLLSYSYSALAARARYKTPATSSKTKLCSTSSPGHLTIYTTCRANLGQLKVRPDIAERLVDRCG
jgi:hypothetical protein